MSTDANDSSASAANTKGPQASADSTIEHHVSAAGRMEHVAAPIDADTVAQALEHGPRGALVVASISVGLLFIGWLLFYFVLFMPRGPVG
jgi:hypothetical protein